jgi:hypothetical protein
VRSAAKRVHRLKKQNPKPREKQRSQTPYHIYSQMVEDWIAGVVGTPIYLETQKGGLQQVLAETDKWNWDRVRTVILPEIESAMVILKEVYEGLRRELRQKEKART